MGEICIALQRVAETFALLLGKPQLAKLRTERGGFFFRCLIIDLAPFAPRLLHDRSTCINLSFNTKLRWVVLVREIPVRRSESSSRAFCSSPQQLSDVMLSWSNSFPPRSRMVIVLWLARNLATIAKALGPNLFPFKSKPFNFLHPLSSEGRMSPSFSPKPHLDRSTDESPLCFDIAVATNFASSTLWIYFCYLVVGVFSCTLALRYPLNYCCKHHEVQTIWLSRCIAPSFRTIY